MDKKKGSLKTKTGNTSILTNILGKMSGNTPDVITEEEKKKTKTIKHSKNEKKELF